MAKIFFCTSVQILLIFFSCEAQQPARAQLERFKKEIAKSNEIYFNAFTKGDSSTFSSCFTSDCWIMQPNAPTLCGEKAAIDFFRIAYESIGIRNGRFITIDVFGNGAEFVTEEGFWESFDVNNKLLDSGKFLVLWKKTPAGWKRFRDSFNSDHKNQSILNK